MKPSALLLAALLASAAGAAEPAKNPSYFELLTRWTDRPVPEIQGDAERGDAVAQFYLGKLLVAGRGVARDPERGIALLKRAVDQGNAEAMTELARCHYLGLGPQQNHSEAVRLGREAAGRGNAAGINLMGVFHQLGIGMPANPTEAIRLYRQAADLGNPFAMRNLGGAHLDGIAGVSHDLPEANRWYLRAAEAGHAESMVAYGHSLLVGRGIAQNKDAALQWFLRAAAAGDSQGLRLMAGQVVADPRAVLLAWRQAAKLGDAEAQFHLAQLVSSGEIEPQGPEETPQRLLQAAAEGEQVYAALMLGDRYRWGYGGPRDLVTASRWFSHGASFVGDLHDPTAKIKVGSGSYDPAMPGGLNNWFQEQDWRARRKGEDAILAGVLEVYLRAAAQRDAAAMLQIASLYQRGVNVPVDPVEAAAWLLLASQSGSAKAASDAATALKNLPTEQQQRARDRTRHLIKRVL